MLASSSSALALVAGNAVLLACGAAMRIVIDDEMSFSANVTNIVGGPNRCVIAYICVCASLRSLALKGTRAPEICRNCAVRFCTCA